MRFYTFLSKKSCFHRELKQFKFKYMFCETVTPCSTCMVYRIAIKMNLISPFMTGCAETLHKLKQTCIFQLPYCVCMYDILRLSSMKVLKGKTVYKINGLVKNIATEALTC